MPSEKKRVSIVFEKNKNAITVPVTGAFGNTSPDGSSVISHFFIEHPTTPNSIEIEVIEGEPINQNLGNQIKRGDFSREIQATFVMSPEQAISIGTWLKRKGEEANSIRESR
ncbi:MAG: hypothetical protein WD491_09725 [Balneolales bacterium]